MKIKDFDAVKITLASPDQILSWSFGEVKKAETINYRTQRAEVDGLMCERIFGPTKNYECYCGKYKKIRYKGIKCDKCGVEVTHKRVRRERLGHVKLAAPVTHVWFAHGIPCKLSLVLGIPQKKLNSVIYFARYIVIGVDKDQKQVALDMVEAKRAEALQAIKLDLEKELSVVEKEQEDAVKEIEKKHKGKKDVISMQTEQTKFKLRQKAAKIREQFARQETEKVEQYRNISDLVKTINLGESISEDDYIMLREEGLPEFFELKMGADGVKDLLVNLDLDKLSEDLRVEAKSRSKQKRTKAIQRLRIVDGLRKNNIRPEWMVLDVLPVLPPDLRPIIQLAGGRFATSDLNDLYRRVINRNNRLKRLMDLGAPEIILRNEKRMLQEAVDALIDNMHRPGRAVLNARRQEYKSLADMLRGKKGRFRQNLLGKRVDYSGRSVIVGGPELRLDQCGIPNMVALELFKPFVIREILVRDLAPNIRAAKNVFDEKSSEVWDILDEVIQNRPVLLNRAPTLHKQGIQAFYPVLTEGNAIRINPLVCKGFNADFDGDQMAVHVPLSKRAVEEAKSYMLSKQNILLMADGTPVVSADQDMVLGCYYLTGTGVDTKDYSEKYLFADANEAISAFDNKKVHLRDLVRVRVNNELLVTTVGRVIFNEILPADFEFINEQVNKGKVKSIISKCLRTYNEDVVSAVLDGIKETGFKYATISGFSVGITDLVTAPERDGIINSAESKDEELMTSYYAGLITEGERKTLSQQNWLEATDQIAEFTWKAYDNENPLNWLEVSGARPVMNPTRQISGIRGLILDAQGKIVDLPLKSNFSIGLNAFEYFVGSKSTRKGLSDTALKTSESGYLTRRLVDVAQDLITREDDCGHLGEGYEIKMSANRRIDYEKRITGRWTTVDVIDPKTKKVLYPADTEITVDVASDIVAKGIESVIVRSPLTCKLQSGICMKCYGYDLGRQKPVNKGVAVGVVAAQAMGEAATQLTLDTKHLAGRVGTDITQGLPRVEELFEARSPKGEAIISEIDGVVEIIVGEDDAPNLVRITNKKSIEKVIKLEKGDLPSFKKSKNLRKGDVLYTKQSGEDVIIDEAGRVNLATDGSILFTKETLEQEEYKVGKDDELVVGNGDSVIAGTAITTGSIDPKLLHDYMGVKEAERYIIDEIQRVYGSQGISIDDKHVELVVRQMSKYAKILDPGDSNYLFGDLVDYIGIEKINKELKAEGKVAIRYKRKLVGITTSAIKTESFLSAASFQEQVRVLTDAALVGKKDYLRGLKENVIIGRLVPLRDSLDRTKLNEEEDAGEVQEVKPVDLNEEEKFQDNNF